MNVEEIVGQYLKEHGFDGLYSEDRECACEIDDLMPYCDENLAGCSPGYKTPCDCKENHPFHISPNREEP